MPYAVQQLDTLRWQASAPDGTALGQAQGRLRPDGRCVARLPQDAPDTWGDLAAALGAEASRPLITSVPAEDNEQADTLRRAGFGRTRLEQHWLIPVAPAPDRLDDHRLHHRASDHYDLVSARHTVLAALCSLDNPIRQDIPGTRGWVGTISQMAEELDDDQFDPALYVVARRRSDAALVGLLRVWNRSPHPRVGCLGVIAPLRRTSLSTRLVQAVGAELRSREVEAVTTETDVSNAASHTLVRRMGGEPTRLSAQWEYPVPASPPAAAVGH